MAPRRQALVKPKFRQALVELITEAGAAGGCPKAQGALLYTTASKVQVCGRVLGGAVQGQRGASKLLGAEEPLAPTATVHTTH